MYPFIFYIYPLPLHDQIYDVVILNMKFKYLALAILPFALALTESPLLFFILTDNPLKHNRTMEIYVIFSQEVFLWNIQKESEL